MLLSPPTDINSTRNFCGFVRYCVFGASYCGKSPNLSRFTRFSNESLRFILLQAWTEEKSQILQKYDVFSD